MRQISVLESISLDGVMQAPGKQGEDDRGGFAHGGWAGPYADEVAGREMGAGFGQGELLFGRRTYDAFFDHWPKQTDGNPFTAVLDATTKHVVSRTSTEPLPWQNSVLLAGEAVDTVTALKATDGPDLLVIGSGDLVRTLLRHGLVDSMTLLIHPLVLGSGTKLFDGEFDLGRYRLVRSVPTTTGVIIAMYEADRDTEAAAA